MGYRAVSAAYWRRRALKAEAKRAPPWQDINQLKMSDDLMWFAIGDTFDGPRCPRHDDYDRYAWFCLAEPPPLPEE